jgi:ubiquinone biosynthesis protein COQ4
MGLFMKSVGKILRTFKLTGKLSWLGLRLIRNPMDISPIFEVDEFLSHQSFKYTVNYCRSLPEMREMMDQRYLAPAVYDLKQLSQCPEGSLGFVFAKHMQQHKMDVVFYPPLKNPEVNDMNYLRLRARETHDVHHCVLGFRPHHLGEMQISAFYLRQINSPLSAFLMAMGILVALIKKPHMIQDIMEAYITGWQMGKQSKPIMAMKWEELWDRPINEVRDMLGIKVEKETFEQPTQKEIEDMALARSQHFFKYEGKRSLVS